MHAETHQEKLELCCEQALCVFKIQFCLQQGHHKNHTEGLALLIQS